MANTTTNQTKQTNHMTNKATHETAPQRIIALLADLSRLDEEDRRAGGTPDASRRDARSALVARLPSDPVRHYDRLVGAGKRPAVATATRGYCGSCHMAVPPQLMLVLSRGEQICRCPSCGRFLAVEPPPSTDDDGQARRA